MKPTRRRMILGGTAVLCAGALGYEGWRHLARHYPSTPYDDLLDRLPDRETARKLGAEFLAANPDFSPPFAAKALRQRLGDKPLPAVLQQEIDASQLSEAGHWILPETLAGLCALAAKV